MLLSAVTFLGIAACAETKPSLGPTDQGPEETIPTPISSVIAKFVWQTDGLFGYGMLRPAGWNSVNIGVRGYVGPGFYDTSDRISLTAVNLQALDQGPNEAIPQLLLFVNRPFLEGWTAGVEQMYKSDGFEATLLSTLPQAKIYSVKQPGSSELQIVAYAVDKGQPLIVGLEASGSYAALERLREEGVLDDFGVMVSSVQAIQKDPENVEPALE